MKYSSTLGLLGEGEARVSFRIVEFENVLSSSSTFRRNHRDRRTYLRQLELDVTRTRRNVLELDKTSSNSTKRTRSRRNVLELIDTKRDSGFALAQES